MAISSDPGARRLLAQAGLGAVLGLSVLVGLLLTDAAGLATLVFASDLWVVAVTLLAFQFAAGFATFAVTTALALPPSSQPQGRTARPLLRAAVANRRQR
jgi:hypothetical protein